jgi:hypothetical protein
MATHRVYRFVIAVGFALSATVIALRPSPASASVTAVTGGAFGVSAPNVTLFGGAQTPFGPAPAVTLPAGGSATAVTGSAPSENVAFGPATFLNAGPVTVSTVGTPAGGSVTSSTSIQGTTQAAGTCPGTTTSCVYAGPLTAASVASTCTAAQTGTTASTTVGSGVLVTATDTSGNPTATVTVPNSPPVNDSITGFLYASSTDKESFTYTFNQQTTNPDGSITVTAAHEVLGGPTAKGDLYLGQATCGVTTASTTSTSTATTLAGATTTTSTTAPSTTTTSTTTAPMTTTTVPLQVGGSAYGYYLSVSLFGGPVDVTGPKPEVQLPPGGSAKPVTASASSADLAFGPANFLSGGAVSVSTSGTPSAGSVTSSASMQGTTQPSATCPGSETVCISAGSFTADSVASTCSGKRSGNTASTTITNGKLVVATDTSGNPTTTVAIPANPPPNDTINGYLYASDTDKESFTYIFNQQITDAKGSITVNAGHEVLHGPVATGDLIFGDAVCATVASASSSTNAQAAAAAAAAATGSGSLANSGASPSPLVTLAVALLAAGWTLRCWAEDVPWQEGDQPE